MKRVTVNFQDECHLRLKLFAAAKEMTINEVMIEAAKLYVQCNSKHYEIAKELLKENDESKDQVNN